jgi:hypothetical protein
MYTEAVFDCNTLQMLVTLVSLILCEKPLSCFLVCFSYTLWFSHTILLLLLLLFFFVTYTFALIIVWLKYLFPPFFSASEA